MFSFKLISLFNLDKLLHSFCDGLKIQILSNGMMSKNPNPTHGKQGFIPDSELIQDAFQLWTALTVISHQNGGRKTSGDKYQQCFEGGDSAELAGSVGLTQGNTTCSMQHIQDQTHSEVR